MSESPSRATLNKQFIEKEVKDGKRQYIFDKNHHAETLLHNLRILMQESEDDDLTDVIIISEDDKRFRFHGPILASLSDTPQDQYASEIREPFSSDAIQCLWDYAYRSAVKLNAENVNDVKELAVRYGLDDLKNECEELEEDFEEDGDDVVLEFKELPAKVLDGLNSQLQKQMLCSTTTVIKGSKSLVGLPCHTAILAAASSKFNDELAHQRNRMQLQVSDRAFEVITPFVQYIYTAKISMDGVTVLPLMDTALVYTIPGIVHAGCSWLKDAVVPENALGILNASQSMMSEANGDNTDIIEHLQNLLRSTRRFILDNFLKVKDEDEFIELTYEELKDLIVDDDLVLDSEEDVFHAVMRWVEYDIQTRAPELPNLLKAIRLEHTSIDFLEAILNHDLVKGNLDCINVIGKAVSGINQFWKERELDELYKETYASFDQTEFVPAESIPDESSDIVTRKTPVDMRLKRNRKAYLERGRNIDGTPDMRLKENKDEKVSRKLEFTDASPRRQDGKLDMRFKVNRKSLERVTGNATLKLLRQGPTTKKGLPDMRFKANRSPQEGIISNGPKKLDGSPDMRFSANKQPVKIKYAADGKEAVAGPLKKDGTPDMRFADNKKGSYQGSSSKGIDATRPLKKNGTPDMRFTANTQRGKRTSKNTENSPKPPNSSVSSSQSPIEPFKKDGTPDMRYKDNKSHSTASTVSLSSLSSTPRSSGPPKQDGTPDMRYSSNKSTYGSGSSDSSYGGSSISSLSPRSSGPLKQDGTPDMRYSSNRSTYGSGSSYSSYGGSSYSSGSGSGGSSSYTPSGPLKSNGTPDMRYSANRR